MEREQELGTSIHRGWKIKEQGVSVEKRVQFHACAEKSPTRKTNCACVFTIVCTFAGNEQRRHARLACTALCIDMCESTCTLACV